MPPRLLNRRTLLGAASLPVLLPLLGGCSTPLPLIPPPAQSDTAARKLLRRSAEAHGLEAYRAITDVNVSYDGQWRPLIDKIQPEVVDAGFRGSSQERLLPAEGIVAQEYLGPKGRKHVLWQRRDAANVDSTVAVWRNGEMSTDPLARTASALVAEGYGLFLLGPLWVETRLADSEVPMRVGGTEQVDGQLCDVLDLWLSPGLGLSTSDRIALCIGRNDGITRRIRFTLEGFVNTQGAVAEVDSSDHTRRFGMLWPMRSFERVLHPIAVPAHDWHITALDVNRGVTAAELTGPRFTGAAAADAKPI